MYLTCQPHPRLDVCIQDSLGKMHVFQALIEVVAECQTLPHIKTPHTPPNVNGECNGLGRVWWAYGSADGGIFQAHRSMKIALSNKISERKKNIFCK